jgi:hypothetical protein
LSKRAATAVVITRIVQINNAVAFHVGLASQEINAEEFGGNYRSRCGGQRHRAWWRSGDGERRK